MAVAIAHDRHCNGGVSELLSRLILAESKRKRGIATKTQNQREGVGGKNK